ncbi:SH3 domain-containing protein [Paraburkholderia terrae]|uniref:Peptide-binding protein n=1 Tax=Paraburkholderia terrae TaxID=311230 RepID=A0A2I8EJB0_9BURK|nr:SH3 domain-containing protein [Paraburkholderia terrae]AUT59570.1 peptide-binding protein [Paraburkholderia terrae]
MRMRVACVAVMGTVALSIASGAASAQSQAYTNQPVYLYAGPAQDYPVVAQLPAGQPVAVYGCVSGYTWCDVAIEQARGWVYGGYLTYPYQGSNVPIMTYGTAIGLPLITFSIGSYWDHYYRGRPWYGERGRWANHPPPPHRPPPPPPGGNRPPPGGNRPPSTSPASPPPPGPPGAGHGHRPGPPQQGGRPPEAPPQQGSRPPQAPPQEQGGRPPGQGGNPPGPPPAHEGGRPPGPPAAPPAARPSGPPPGQGGGHPSGPPGGGGNARPPAPSGQGNEGTNH